MPDAPQRAVRRIEGEIADARVPQQHPGPAGRQVQGAEVPPIGVVGGIEQRPGRRIVRQRGHGVSRGAQDLRQVRDLPGRDVDGGEVGDLARIADPQVDGPARRVVIGAGHRAERVIGQRAEGRDRVPADGRQVGRLPVALPCDPSRPLVLERSPIDVPELRREVPPAAFGPVEPRDQAVVPVAQPQVADEPRAVEIGVHAHLEVDRGPFRFQSDEVEDAGAVPDQGAEHHLVVGTDGTPQPPIHPRLEIDGDPFQVPPRRIPPRRGQVAVEHGQGDFGVGRDLAEEQRPVESVRRGGFVYGHDVRHLVVERRGHPFRGGRGLVVVAVRRDPDGDVILRDRARARVAVMPEVMHQHVDRAGRRVVEETAVELQRVLEAPGHLRDQVGLERRREDQPHVPGLEHLELRGESSRRANPYAGQDGQDESESGHGQKGTKLLGDPGSREIGPGSPRDQLTSGRASPRA